MLQIYKASAGSGKTFNLTKQYIKFLLAEKHDDGLYYLRSKPKSEHSRILAITFTNKATAEMTQRIIKELALLAGMPAADELATLGLDTQHRGEATSKSKYTEEFTHPQTGLHCDVETLRKAARTALTQLLYDYSYFNVSTIDSFFQSVLRMFTREVELPDNYNVELNSTYAVAVGVDEMFNSLNYHTIAGTPEYVEQQWVKKWLYAFMSSNMDKGAGFNMFSRASGLYRNLVKNLNDIANEDFKRRIIPLREYFSDISRVTRFENALKTRIDEAGKQSIESFSRVLKGIPDKYIKTTRIEDLKLGKVLDSDASIINAEQNPMVFLNKKKCREDNFAISPEQEEAIREFSLAYSKLKNVRSELLPLLNNIHIFGLLSIITRNIDKYCRDNSMVLLNETNNILQGLIGDDETPFIYERLGYYLNHFLIDEFQDTSPMQWDNLRPLVMESLSRNNDNLIIGDEKQCIYRFRNSDPRLLGSRVQEETINTYETDEIVDIAGTDIKENSNWRSGIEIVKFNNTLFKAMAAVMDNGTQDDKSLSVNTTYANIIQQIDSRRDELHGYVKVKFAPEQKSGGKGKKNTDDTADVKEKAQQRDESLDFMVKEMRRQFAAGYKPGDIAVLVRSNDQGSAIINHLLTLMNDPESGFPQFDIISEEAMKLSAASSVRLIISILRLVSLPEFLEADAEAEARINDKPSTGTKMSEAYRRARLVNRFMFYMHHTHDDGSTYSVTEALENALVDNRNLDLSGDGTIKSLLDMDCLNLQGIVERIIHRYVPEQLKERENLFITTLQDLVIEFSHNNGHDIGSFLSWWDKVGYKSSLSTPPNRNALTVMTIHKSKGLEFPCVHIPYANHALFSGTMSWIDLDGSQFESMGIDPADVPCAMPINVSTKITGSSIYGDPCREVIAQSRIDELNVAYVAYTRATRELCIYYNITNVKEESLSGKARKAIGIATDEFISGLGLEPGIARWLTPLAPHLDGDVLTLGEPTTPQAEKIRKDSVKRFDMPVYTTTDTVLQAPLKTKTDTIDPLDINDQRHLGNFLHAVMSGVTDRSHLTKSMRRQAYRHHIEEHIVAKLTRRLEMAMSNEECARWFDDYEKVITERPMTMRDKELRPDRIVWLPDGSIDVVDYKFVNALPDDLENDGQHKKYADKLEEYCMGVKGNTHATVRGYLWYIAPQSNIIIQTYPLNHL
ncbi:MAG: UvrD-helicase domain-containing protein [Clostridiales bacterium]|nr:UvrD-helicase domain-containing protein [Clostridiales bacterium]